MAMLRRLTIWWAVAGDAPMSTKSTIWLGTDESSRDCHLYWELAERIPGRAAPIFVSIEARGKQAAIRLPREVAEKIREILEPDAAWEVI